MSRPSSEMRAGARAAQAGKRLGELDLAVAVDAGDAENLAAAHLERERAEPRSGETVDREPHRALRARASARAEL